MLLKHPFRRKAAEVGDGGSIAVSGLAPASGQTFNVGTFALLWVSDPFVLSVR